MTTAQVYPRAIVTRHTDETSWQGIGSDGTPEWRWLFAWQALILRGPINRMFLGRAPFEQTFQDHDSAVHWAHAEVARLREAA